MATALDHSPLFACGSHAEGGNLRRFFGALDELRTRRGARVLCSLHSGGRGRGVLWAPLRPRRLSKLIWGKRSGGEGGRGSEMTRRVTLKPSGEHGSKQPFPEHVPTVFDITIR